ncbi:MAG: hypothetical protein JWL81_84 [Verrucomicrobiales bacterium]|nr:hypothetical protein [Verrucomicrobiales bacterium]
MASSHNSGNLPGRFPGQRAKTESAFRNAELPGGARSFGGRWLSGGLAVAVSFWGVSCAGDSVDARAAGGLAGKEMGAGGSFGPGYPPGSAGWSVKARTAYRTAFVAGMQDQKDGFRYDDDRGALALDVDLRGFFRQGYRRGYYHEATLRRLRRGQNAPADPVEPGGPGREGGPGLPAADGRSGWSNSPGSSVPGQGRQSGAAVPGPRGDLIDAPPLDRLDPPEAPVAPAR